MGCVLRNSPVTAANPVPPVKIPLLVRRALALSVPLAALPLGHTQTPAPAAAPGDEAVQLPQFNVSGEKADSYRAADTMSLARIRGALIDTPLTVNVLTRELFDDLGANST